MDRNFYTVQIVIVIMQSLSARRAWIEINHHKRRLRDDCVVALRKESVDRNRGNLNFGVDDGTSLSARRAWIEIDVVSVQYRGQRVALRKESVDRNQRRQNNGAAISLVALRKESVDRNCQTLNYMIDQSTSLSARRAWIEIARA